MFWVGGRSVAPGGAGQSFYSDSHWGQVLFPADVEVVAGEGEASAVTRKMRESVLQAREIVLGGDAQVVVAGEEGASAAAKQKAGLP